MNRFMTTGLLGFAALVFMGAPGCFESAESSANAEQPRNRAAFGAFGTGGFNPDARNCVPTPTEASYAPTASEYMVSLNGTSIAQTFTPPKTMRVAIANLPLYTCKANGLVDAKLTIMGTDSLGRPDRSMQIASAIVPNSQLRDSCIGGAVFEVEGFVFSDVLLAGGTRYALVLDVMGARGGGVSWRRSSTPADPSNPYPDGTLYRGSQSSWMALTNLDAAFAIQGLTVCP